MLNRVKKIVIVLFFIICSLIIICGIVSVVVVLVPKKRIIVEYTGERVSIVSYDGKTMVGYLKKREKKSSKWAILIHSYRSDHTFMNPYAEKYLDNGYNILQPDNRAHGQSEGNYIGLGYLDQYDILEWIKYIIIEDPGAEIVLHGVSMGATAAMILSGQEGLPENLVAIIADCGYKSAKDYLSWKINHKLHLPAFPIIQISNLSFKIAAGYYLEDCSAINQVVHSKKPLLLIHGSADATVPVEDAYELYRAASCQKDIYIAQGAGHAESLFVDENIYWEKVFGFINRFLSYSCVHTG